MKHFLYFILQRIISDLGEFKLKKMIMKLFNSLPSGGIQFLFIEVAVYRIRANCKISTKNTTQSK
jgi:hypothetical protein